MSWPIFIRIVAGSLLGTGLYVRSIPLCVSGLLMALAGFLLALVDGPKEGSGR
jgi:hypothetical protein